jgi:hypothetical protein
MKKLSIRTLIYCVLVAGMALLVAGIKQCSDDGNHARSSGAIRPLAEARTGSTYPTAEIDVVRLPVSPPNEPATREREGYHWLKVRCWSTLLRREVQTSITISLVSTNEQILVLDTPKFIMESLPRDVPLRASAQFGSEKGETNFRIDGDVLRSDEFLRYDSDEGLMTIVLAQPPGRLTIRLHYLESSHLEDLVLCVLRSKDPVRYPSQLTNTANFGLKSSGYLQTEAYFECIALAPLRWVVFHSPTRAPLDSGLISPLQPDEQRLVNVHLTGEPISGLVTILFDATRADEPDPITLIFVNQHGIPIGDFRCAYSSVADGEVVLYLPPDATQVLYFGTTTACGIASVATSLDSASRQMRLSLVSASPARISGLIDDSDIWITLLVRGVYRTQRLQVRVSQVGDSHSEVWGPWSDVVQGAIINDAYYEYVRTNPTSGELRPVIPGQIKTMPLEVQFGSNVPATVVFESLHGRYAIGCVRVNEISPGQSRRIPINVHDQGTILQIHSEDGSILYRHHNISVMEQVTLLVDG